MSTEIYRTFCTSNLRLVGISGLKPLELMKKHNAMMSARREVKNGNTECMSEEESEASESTSDSEDDLNDLTQEERIEKIITKNLNKLKLRKVINHKPDVLERQTIWMEKKLSRIREYQKLREDNMQLELKFHPELHNSLMSWEKTKKRSEQEQERLDRLEQERDARREQFRVTSQEDLSLLEKIAQLEYEKTKKKNSSKSQKKKKQLLSEEFDDELNITNDMNTTTTTSSSIYNTMDGNNTLLSSFNNNVSDDAAAAVINSRRRRHTKHDVDTTTNTTSYSMDMNLPEHHHHHHHHHHHNNNDYSHDDDEDDDDGYVYHTLIERIHSSPYNNATRMTQHPQQPYQTQPNLKKKKKGKKKSKSMKSQSSEKLRSGALPPPYMNPYMNDLTYMNITNTNSNSTASYPYPYPPPTGMHPYTTNSNLSMNNNSRYPVLPSQELEEASNWFSAIMKERRELLYEDWEKSNTYEQLHNSVEVTSSSSTSHQPTLSSLSNNVYSQPSVSGNSNSLNRGANNSYSSSYTTTPFNRTIAQPIPSYLSTNTQQPNSVPTSQLGSRGGGGGGGYLKPISHDEYPLRVNSATNSSSSNSYYNSTSTVKDMYEPPSLSQIQYQTTPINIPKPSFSPSPITSNTNNTNTTTTTASDREKPSFTTQSNTMKIADIPSQSTITTVTSSTPPLTTISSVSNTIAGSNSETIVNKPTDQPSKIRHQVNDIRDFDSSTIKRRTDRINGNVSYLIGIRRDKGTTTSSSSPSLVNNKKYEIITIIYDKEFTDNSSHEWWTQHQQRVMMDIE